MKKQILYIGKDGKEYDSYDKLILADKEYFQTHFPYIGEDGKTYSTMEELINANTRYWDSMRIIKDIENTSPIAADFRQSQVANKADSQMSIFDSQRIFSPNAADKQGIKRR